MAHDHNALSNSKLYTNMACWLLIIWPDPLVYHSTLVLCLFFLSYANFLCDLPILQLKSEVPGM
jgi:hypothetical protein